MFLALNGRIDEAPAWIGRRQAIAPMDQPLNLQYGLAPSVVQQLRIELGGRR